MHILKPKAQAVSMIMCTAASGAGRGRLHGYNVILASEKMGSRPLEIAVCREGSKQTATILTLLVPSI